MQTIQPSRHPLVLVLILIGFILAAILISQFLVLASLYPIMGKKVLMLGQIIADPSSEPDFRMVMLYVQGSSMFISMVVSTLLFFRYFYPKNIGVFEDMPKEYFFLITALIVIVFMPADSWIAEQNLKMKLPAFLSELEKWMANSEQKLKILTEYLTHFDTNSEFLVGMVVIALIPAIGEELVFRAGLQNLLNDAFKNKHVAIWLAAIIFSGIHMQFYGFFPRLFLGAIFGYLYFWSGSILIPMTGHFVNNGFTLILIHMKNINQIQVDLETTKDMPLGLILGSAGLFAALLGLFYFQSKKEAIG